MRVLAANGGNVWRVAARAAILDGEQAQPAVEALLGNGMMAVLAVDRVRRSELAAGLADMEQLGGRAGGGAPLKGGAA